MNSTLIQQLTTVGIIEVCPNDYKLVTFLFLMNTMINTITVTVIPVAKIAPTVTPTIHTPPQPNNTHM